MPPRSWPYRDVDGADLPVRDRPYESFGQQGIALPTYGDEPEAARGAERVDLGEPIAEVPADLSKTAPGPKGWQRRDDRIHDDVCARLTDDGYVDASDLEVVVHHGEVVLTGGVADRVQRERAVHIAETVQGVVDVISRLRVTRAER
jgi:osmotically-inducible protein OsmY